MSIEKGINQSREQQELPALPDGLSALQLPTNPNESFQSMGLPFADAVQAGLNKFLAELNKQSADIIGVIPVQVHGFDHKGSGRVETAHFAIIRRSTPQNPRS